ncbi:MAG TPA: S53 family peptidase [Solirubrobacterales bacterium]|nr:S53 family peptidase [Solirubrobacterales bacterium]
MQRSRLIVIALVALAASLLCAAPATAQTAAAERVGTPPDLPQDAAVTSAVPPQRQLQLYVALEPRDPAGLERFAAEVSTPGSAAYGRYLTVPEFAQRFGAAPAQIATVRSALAARGLDVGPAATNGLSLPVTATAAQAESAFGVSLNRVRLASGRVAYANDRAPALPAAAAPFVQGVLGLDDVTLSRRRDADAEESLLTRSATASATTSAADSGTQPCAAAQQTGKDVGGYTADQVAAAYGFDDFYAAGNFGAGQTVALLELEPFLPSDIATYQSCYGTSVDVSTVDVNGGPGPYKGEDGEAALDIEQLIGLAPGADIVVYQAPNGGGAEAEILSAFVQQDVAKVMSSSWGICEKWVENESAAAMDTLLQEAAAQGQSFFVAAGDEGSTDCYEAEGDHDKALAVDFPGSHPFATDVGGTRMEEPTATTPTEYLWNEAPEWGAGGGGLSEHFPMPSYQRQAAAGLGVVGALSSGETCGFSYCRQVPDVSANASLETGYVTHTEDQWDVSGGTSAAAPLWAAFAALTNASPSCHGHSIGFANPALYAIAGSDYAANFHDVTAARPGGLPTNNRFDSSQPFPATAGYDMATGLGTPKAGALAASLCALAAPAPPAPPVAGSGGPGAAPVPAATTARLVRVSITGVARGKPKLTFTLAPRPGAMLRSVVVSLPPGLRAATEPTALAKGVSARGADGTALGKQVRASARTLRIHLADPQPTASFKLAFPALEAAPNLIANVKSGRARTRELLLGIRETGGKGARLPAVLRLGS